MGSVKSQYEATALTTYTWQVKYANNLNSEPSPRIEEFATTSLLNRNGLKPSGAVTGPDDRGLWWPALPPRPTVDDVEERQGSEQEASRPELLKRRKSGGTDSVPPPEVFEGWGIMPNPIRSPSCAGEFNPGARS